MLKGLKHAQECTERDCSRLREAYLQEQTLTAESLCHITNVLCSRMHRRGCFFDRHVHARMGAHLSARRGEARGGEGLRGEGRRGEGRGGAARRGAARRESERRDCVMHVRITDGPTDGRARAGTPARPNARTHGRTHASTHARTHDSASSRAHTRARTLWILSPAITHPVNPEFEAGSNFQHAGVP